MEIDDLRAIIYRQALFLSSLSYEDFQDKQNEMRALSNLLNENMTTRDDAEIALKNAQNALKTAQQNSTLQKTVVPKIRADITFTQQKYFLANQKVQKLEKEKQILLKTIDSLKLELDIHTEIVESLQPPVQPKKSRVKDDFLFVEIVDQQVNTSGDPPTSQASNSSLQSSQGFKSVQFKTIQKSEITKSTPPQQEKESTSNPPIFVDGKDEVKVFNRPIPKAHHYQTFKDIKTLSQSTDFNDFKENFEFLKLGFYHDENNIETTTDSIAFAGLDVFNKGADLATSTKMVPYIQTGGHYVAVVTKIPAKIPFIKKVAKPIYKTAKGCENAAKIIERKEAINEYMVQSAMMFHSASKQNGYLSTVCSTIKYSTVMACEDYLFPTFLPFYDWFH
ncbi:hypothetical protein EIN_274140 [Entamoeba invadens IP1]|uniref:Uncharacterized protein n=1 Tax=Entamoeba invadens IP1 TaxID=370355 RepID=A0A0A1U1G0_ENTIV|nr:hypothetical protein EIN_274140 [Entamoeba invadens IP1]ELP87847.1 hypothetical protein EIN_274140 [Entamoeba invadens IP1]|eukprot:XP_004254618.1 hypothetical protein EIN_274140 [Entamoeba invadens IP1]